MRGKLTSITPDFLNLNNNWNLLDCADLQPSYFPTSTRSCYFPVARPAPSQCCRCDIGPKDSRFQGFWRAGGRDFLKKATKKKEDPLDERARTAFKTIQQPCFSVFILFFLLFLLTLAEINYFFEIRDLSQIIRFGAVLASGTVWEESSSAFSEVFQRRCIENCNIAPRRTKHRGVCVIDHHLRFPTQTNSRIDHEVISNLPLASPGNRRARRK